MSDAQRSFRTHVLRDAEHDAEVHVVPARGGMVTRFRVGANEVLYLDPTTLADPSKKVRGGIPVLFPIAGRLTDDRYRARGREYSLKQHGFAREMPWEIRATPSPSSVVLGLTGNDATLAMFPWRFRLTIAYALSGGTLSIDFSCENDDTEALPLHVGFHPYFHVPDALKSKTTIDTDATTARDNTTGEVVAFSGFDLTLPTLDLQLLDHTEHGTQLAFGQRRIRLDTDVELSTLVVWTVSGKDYVCVEPWSAPSDALNTGEGVIHVPARTTHSLRWSITADL